MSRKFTWVITGVDLDACFMDVAFSSSSVSFPMRMPLPIQRGRVLEGDELSRFILTRAPMDRLDLGDEHRALIRERLTPQVGVITTFTKADYQTASTVPLPVTQIPRTSEKVVGPSTAPGGKSWVNTLQTPVLRIT